MKSVERSKGKDIFAVSDESNYIHLYRNPILEGSKSKAFRGHSNNAGRLKFDAKDQKLFSVGAHDRTIMQWKVTN